MGPYREERQRRRAELIASILVNTSDPEVKRIWTKHLTNLAGNEIDYNRRVAQVYGDKKWNQYIGTSSLTQ